MRPQHKLRGTECAHRVASQATLLGAVAWTAWTGRATGKGGCHEQGGGGRSQHGHTLSLSTAHSRSLTRSHTVMVITQAATHTQRHDQQAAIRGRSGQVRNALGEGNLRRQRHRGGRHGSDYGALELAAGSGLDTGAGDSATSDSSCATLDGDVQRRLFGPSPGTDLADCRS